jgi:threonyl-tRNA synthetase
VEAPDHRRLGRQLKIFTTDEVCGAGLPLWLPAGAVVRSELERFIVEIERRAGYQHVYTPELAKQALYERSGHWAHYHDDMYPPMELGAERVVLRPMNCPHHILVYQSEPRTARHIPLRLAELGTMFRYERSGVVGGLSRVRQMTLNDGHVFCGAEHVESEIAGILELVGHAYRTLSIPPPTMRLSLRGDGPKYAADPSMWARSENMIRSALDNLGIDYVDAPGEAAFYGPKIDLQVRDPQGREETLSTIQVDFHLPERFVLAYRQGPTLERPVMIHRSIISTMERIVAHLLEVHNGSLPVWLAPTQVVVLPVTPSAIDYARETHRTLVDRGVRSDLDDRDDTLASRVRDAGQHHIPYLAVVGDREASAGTVAVRLRTGDRPPPMNAVELAGLVATVSSRRLGTLLVNDDSV